MRYIFCKCESLEISWTINKRSSSSILRKTIYEPHMGIEPAILWWLVRRSNHWATKTQIMSWGASLTYVWPKRKALLINNNIMRSKFWKCERNIFLIILLTYSGFRSGRTCQTCTLAHQLSLGSSMVRATHQSSEGCGFDPRLGLRKRFAEDRDWQTFICHSKQDSEHKTQWLAFHKWQRMKLSFYYYSTKSVMDTQTVCGSQWFGINSPFNLTVFILSFAYVNKVISFWSYIHLFVTLCRVVFWRLAYMFVYMFVLVFI